MSGRFIFRMSAPARLAALWLVVFIGVLSTFPASGLEPEETLGVWEFDEPAQAGASLDWLRGTPMVFKGNAALSADGAGRSGQAGDRALDLGTVAGNYARIDNSAFLESVNAALGANDRISIVFWQRHQASLVNSSSVYCLSAGAGGTNRGLQAHLPWADGRIYYDSAGCCASPGQRLTKAWPEEVDRNQWHHVALIKDGAAKQLWINGVLHMSQSSGAAALTGDWTGVLVGAMHPRLRAGAPHPGTRRAAG